MDENKEVESQYAEYMADNKEFKNKEYKKNDLFESDFKYASALDSESIEHYVKSHGFLYGRYLDENGSLSMATHPIYEFPKTFDKSKIIFDHLRKDIKQETYCNSSQTELMKSGIADWRLQGKAQIAAFGRTIFGGLQGGHTQRKKESEYKHNNSSKLKVITRRDTCFAKVRINDDCLQYTRQFEQDLVDLVIKTLSQTDKTRKVYNEWDDFFHKYGHFTIASATVGGTLYIDTDINTNDSKEISDKMDETRKLFSIGAGASKNESIWSAQGDMSYNNNKQNKNYEKNFNKNKNIVCTLQCIGGNPGLASLSSIDAWENSLIKHFQSWDLIKIDDIQPWHYCLKTINPSASKYEKAVAQDWPWVSFKLEYYRLKKEHFRDFERYWRLRKKIEEMEKGVKLIKEKSMGNDESQRNCLEMQILDQLEEIAKIEYNTGGATKRMIQMSDAQEQMERKCAQSDALQKFDRYEFQNFIENVLLDN